MKMRCAVCGVRCAGGRRAGEPGLTLIELLIALALLGFVLLGVVPLFIASVKSNYSGNEYTSIHVLARDRLEQLMNLPFNDGALSPGVHPNDLPAKLPDPRTGISPTSGGVPNPFRVTYQVFQYQIPAGDTGTVPVNASFTPIRITGAGQVYQYKRIDVTVTAGSGPMGIGARVSRVSDCLANPFPSANLSGDDTAP